MNAYDIQHRAMTDQVLFTGSLFNLFQRMVGRLLEHGIASLIFQPCGDRHLPRRVPHIRRRNLRGAICLVLNPLPIDQDRSKNGLQFDRLLAPADNSLPLLSFSNLHRQFRIRFFHRQSI